MKLKMILNILRGRPVMYRVTLYMPDLPFMRGTSTENYHAIVYQNTFIGPGSPRYQEFMADANPEPSA